MVIQVSEDEREWRAVVGYEGRYEVSNDGLVKSLNYRRTGKPGLISPALSHGYPRCLLANGSKNKSHLVHRLVAMAFFGPPDRADRVTVNHKNGIRHDNRVENLEWASYKEQTAHADIVLGKNNRGENCGMAKLTNRRVKNIAAKLKAGVSVQELAKSYDVTETLIYDIQHGQRWGSVTGLEAVKPGKHVKLSDDDVRGIVKMLQDGKNGVEVAAAFGVNTPMVSRIANGKTRVNVSGYDGRRIGGPVNRHTGSLPDNTIREIRRRHANGASYSSLSRVFGINVGGVYSIVKRESYVHVT